MNSTTGTVFFFFNSTGFQTRVVPKMFCNHSGKMDYAKGSEKIKGLKMMLNTGLKNSIFRVIEWHGKVEKWSFGNADEHTHLFTSVGNLMSSYIQKRRINDWTKSVLSLHMVEYAWSQIHRLPLQLWEQKSTNETWLDKIQPIIAFGSVFMVSDT